MATKRRRPRRKKKTTASHHIALVLFLIVAAVFLYFEEFGKQDTEEKQHVISSPVKKPIKKPVAVIPEVPAPPTLPRVAIVMDDLGINRKKAEAVFALEAPLTLSILPQRRYSAWIAEEGHKRGHDIMLHMPMEATRPLKLGEGGLYLKMGKSEIVDVLNKDIQSIPHIIGASNHMGSAFTENERALKVVISELKKHRLFFLDSFTSSKSAGLRIAKELSVPSLRRDVFLDDSSDPAKIEFQWKRLIKIARKNGSAVALAHPKKNTMEFLESILKRNNEVEIVPLSSLFID